MIESTVSIGAALMRDSAAPRSLKAGASQRTNIDGFGLVR
jgi:hypothetical protein